MSNLFLSPDEFWCCPIDLNHRVLAKRFPYHIRRCMIANPHIRRVRCVFNATHLAAPEHLLSHISTCPDAIDRSTVLMGLSNFMGRDDHRRERSSSPINRRIFHDVNATENWDDDTQPTREQQNRSPTEDFRLISPSTNTIMTHEFNVVESTDRVPKAPNGKTDQITRKAHVFERHDDDALDRLVETDELTTKLLKIRTVQLLSGAGRGVCRLLQPAPNSSAR